MTREAILAEGPHKFRADGITLSYIVSGAGPHLVVQSVGWGPSSSYLHNGLRDLESEFTLLYLEPRGNGESSRPVSASAMSTKDMAYDLEHLREHLWGILGAKRGLSSEPISACGGVGQCEGDNVDLGRTGRCGVQRRTG